MGSGIWNSRPQRHDGDLSGGWGEYDKPKDSYTERPIDTIVLIGVMGSGKSSLANILCLRDDQPRIPMDARDQLFVTSASESATTINAKVITTSSNLITEGRQLRIIDIPGLD